MTRHADWQLRLMQYLAEMARRPVDPAAPVCATFTAGAVLAMTGEDHSSPFKGPFKTQAAGLRALRRSGFADHIAYLASHFEEIPVAFCVPGDIAVIETETVPALGIVQGEVIYVQSGAGIGAWPLLNASRAFRVS